MSLPEFNNITEFKTYIQALENRIAQLEMENSNNLNALANVRNELAGARNMRHVFPQTDLLSQNFLKRAFAVWGHYFVAHLVISLIIGTCYVVLVVAGITVLPSIFQ